MTSMRKPLEMPNPSSSSSKKTSPSGKKRRSKTLLKTFERESSANAPRISSMSFNELLSILLTECSTFYAGTAEIKYIPLLQEWLSDRTQLPIFVKQFKNL